MNQPKIFQFAEVIRPYDVLIFDIWGVLYDGIDPYPNVIPFLNNIMESDKKIIFLSNTPRPSTVMGGKFKSWGLNMDKVTIYTSGDALREQLVVWNDEVFKTLGKKCYHLGADRNEDLLRDINIDLTNDIKEADFLLISAYLEEYEDLNYYDDILKNAADLKLQAICPNPDLTVNQSNGIRYCAGTFAKKYETLGGIVHYYGKPDVRVFDALLNRYVQGIDKSKVIMIGDTLNTDILGANRAGIDSVLVLTGNGEKIATEILAGKIDLFEDYLAKPTWISHGVGSI